LHFGQRTSTPRSRAAPKRRTPLINTAGFTLKPHALGKGPMSTRSGLATDIEAVSLAIAYDESCGFEHPALQAAFSHWQKLCAGRTMPKRTELVPREMAAFIAHLGLVEIRRQDDGGVDYFVRLSGSRIDEVIGPRSQRMLTDGLSAEMGARWRAQFDHVLKHSRPLRASGRIAYRNMAWFEIECLYAPLGQAGTIDMILFGFAVSGRSP
jgi:hypothetical protein